MDPPFIALIALNVANLIAFQWGRMRYFRRRSEDRVRGGLGPLGTIFAIAQFPLIWMGGLYSGSFRMAVTLLLYVFALLLFFLAVRSHARVPPGIAFTPGAPQILVTDGAYRIARHPFYLAYLLFWAGVAVMAPFFLGIPILMAMTVLYKRAAMREEDDIMRSPLAGSYAEYKARVGMFFRWPGSR